MKKEKYKKIPKTSKTTWSIPKIFSHEKTHRFVLKVEEEEQTEIERGKEQTEIEEDSNLLIEFDPDLEGEIFPDNNDILKCRLRFYSKEGTHTITKIHQHIGGDISNTRMKIFDMDSKEEIDGGWGNPTVLTVKKDEVKGLMLVFSRIGGNEKAHVGVKIETPEAYYTTDFYIRWDGF